MVVVMASVVRPIAIGACVLSPLGIAAFVTACEDESGTTGGGKFGFDGGFSPPATVDAAAALPDPAAPDAGTDADSATPPTKCASGLWRNFSVDGGIDDGGAEGGTCRTCPLTAFGTFTTNPLGFGNCRLLLNIDSSSYVPATKTLLISVQPGVLEASSATSMIRVFNAAGLPTDVGAPVAVVGNVLAIDLSAAVIQAGASVQVQEVVVTEACGTIVKLNRTMSAEPNIDFSQRGGVLTLDRLTCYF